jgi:hypothetical protein
MPKEGTTVWIDLKGYQSTVLELQKAFEEELAKQ